MKCKHLRVVCLAAFAGLAATAVAAPPTDMHRPGGVFDDEAVFEAPLPPTGEPAVAGAKGIAGGVPARVPAGLRGLPTCPDIINDITNCHVANTALALPFSNEAPAAFKVIDNFVPTTGNPLRLCWVGRYANRVDPIANESFVVRIYTASNELPDLAAGPVFERTFGIGGVAGTDLLEMSCLDGDNCPGSGTTGGHWMYSAEVAAGFPLAAQTCYWIEIACVGTAATGVNWGWTGSQGGNDLLSLQAQSGNYTAFSRIANDRAFCFSGGLLGFDGPNCRTAPLPPVCTNSDANGIPYTAGTTGGRASWPGTDGRGIWTPFQRADSFAFDVPATVTNICFRGFWNGVNDAGGGVAVAPPTDPQFRVAYFSHFPNDGIPGAPVPLAEFAMGDPGVSFVWDGTNLSSFTHPPVNFEADTCYWVSIGRIQSQQAPGQPVTPLWAWRLTSSSNASADERTASRTVGPAIADAWGVTIFRSAFPACDPATSNYNFLLDAGPTTARSCAPPVCPIEIPPTATPNVEPVCATAGNINGGCANNNFTTLTCGETVHGSSSNLLSATSCGNTRDTDWYQLTVAEGTEVTLTLTSQFAGFMAYGVLNAGVTNPTGACSELNGTTVNFVTPIGSCTPSTLTRTLAAGTWTIFVGAIFGDLISCDGVNNNYTLAVSCGGGPVVDCDNNGVADAVQIAGNPSLDCFDRTVPNATGGADGLLDACQCQADWNSDAAVNSGDISSFLTAWIASVQAGTTAGDFDCSGLTNSGDISGFLTLWIAALQNTVPHDGCP